jgi:hypothetical protein
MHVVWKNLRSKVIWSPFQLPSETEKCPYRRKTKPAVIALSGREISCDSSVNLPNRSSSSLPFKGGAVLPDLGTKQKLSECFRDLGIFVP